MIRAPLLIGVMVAGACLAGVFAWGRLRAAEATAESARMSYVQIERDGRGVLRLQEEKEAASLGEPPQDNLIARLGIVATDAGLLRGVVRNVERVDDREIDDRSAGPMFRRRDVRVSLEPIDPAELGLFVARWRVSDPLWAITGIELEARRGRVQPGTPRYVARLKLSAAYSATDPTGAGTP